MKIKIDNSSIFHCPEGTWKGVCEAIDVPHRRISRPCANQVRLRFRVYTSQGEKIVGKTFCADLGTDSELRNYLECWVGDLDRYKDDEDNIDFDGLIGVKADLAIMHGPTMEGHPYPSVNLAGIYRSGYLIEE